MENHNDPLDRLSKANPVPDEVVPNQFALERMIRNASATQPGIWSRARYAVTATSAAIGSGAAVLALIVGLSSAAPELPVLALGGSSTSKMSAPAASADAVAGAASTMPKRVGAMAGDMAIYHPNYNFQVSPDLVVNGDTAGSYQLSNSQSLEKIARDLAQTFKVSGDLVDEGGTFSVTGDDGSSLYVSKYGSLVNWSCSTSQTMTPPDVASTERVAALPAPTNSEAKAKAKELFDAIGYFGTLGNLEASRYDQFVQVAAPLEVNGIETDQTLSASYDSNGLSSANGVMADLGSSVNYPTISASDAVAQLEASWNPAPDTTDTTVVAPDTSGTVDVSGGSNGATNSAPSAVATPAPAVGVAPSSPVTETSGDAVASSPQVDPGATYTTVPPQTVTITTATLRYQTYVLSNGDSWLLPIWFLEGYVGTDHSQTFSDNELAVSSAFVKLPTNTGVMTY
jgi:hypothetical protein